MTFLSPAFLLGVATIGLPIWLHLSRRRKSVPVPFSSLRYLRVAAARTRRQARVEDIGLLVMRCVLLLLLAAALARPVLDARQSWLGLARARAVVVVLDATASMGVSGADGTTRLDKAKRLAANWIGQLAPEDRVAVWVLTDRLEKPVPDPTGDRQEVLAVIDALPPSSGSSPLAPVFAAARDWLASGPPGTPGLVLITDNQPAAWDWPAADFFQRSWRRDAVELLVVQTDADRPGNLAVQPIEWASGLARPGRVLQGKIRVENHGDLPAGDLLEVSADGRQVLRQTLNLAANGSIDVPVSLAVPADATAVIQGQAGLAGDALPADDHWFFALPAQRTVNAVVVEPATSMVGRVRPAFFLARALAAGQAARPTVVDSAAWPNHPLDGVDAVFVCGGVWADGTGSEKARDFARAGGTVVAFADATGDAPPSWWPVSGGQCMTLPSGRIATRILAQDHPLFAGLWHDQNPFPPLPQGTAWRCTAAPGARVLATLAGELPLLVESPIGTGRLLWLNTSADRAWGDFPLSPVYLAMVQQLARLGDLAARAPTQRWVGEGWPETRAGRAAAWMAVNSATAQPRAMRPGQHAAQDAAARTVAYCAVNVRREESDLRPVDESVLAGWLPGHVVTGAAGVDAWNRESKRQVPLWPWLLAAATLVFLAEFQFSARAARRRHARVPA